MTELVPATRWRLIEPGVLAGYARKCSGTIVEERGDGTVVREHGDDLVSVSEAENWQLVSLSLYGDITDARLRSIPLRRISMLYRVEAGYDGLTGRSTEKTAIFDHELTQSEVIDVSATFESEVPPEVLPQESYLMNWVRGAEARSDPLFYERVAKIYVTFAALTGRPVTELAALAQVPHSTAARWVRQCRKRGLLPPGQKGKVK